MKVKVIFTGAYPIGNVTAHRVHNICKGLIANKAEVEVLLMKPAEKANAIRNQDTSGYHEGIHYRYIRGKNIRSSNFLKRRWDDFLSAVATIFHVLLNKSNSDAIIVIGPSFDMRLFIPFAAKCSGIKTVLEINEYPFVTLANSYWTRFQKFVLFHLIFPAYNGFIVISEELGTLIDKYKSTRSLRIKIPILASSHSQDVKSNSPLEHPYLIHSGSISEEKDGMSGILKAFALAREHISDPIKLVVTGDAKNAPEFPRILKLTSKLGIQDNVIFTEFLESEEMTRYLDHAQLAIINKLNTEQNQYCFPTKLAVYAAHKIPVIATKIGESKHFLIDNFNAFLVEEGSPELIAKKMIYALNRSEEISKIANNAYNLVTKEFNITRNGKLLYSFLNDLLE